MLISNIVFTVGSFIGIFFISSAPNVLTLLNLIFKVLVILYVIFAVLFLIYVVSMHLAVRTVRGDGRFNDNFKVICYSFSPINFAWIFVFLMAVAIYLNNYEALWITRLLMLGLFTSVLYMFYMVVIGISVTSDISGSRAFAALMIQFFIFVFITVGLVFSLDFLHQYSTNIQPGYSPTRNTPIYENYTPLNPEKYRIITYAGSPPQIDGIIDYDDRWFEGDETIIESRGQYYAVTTKHDFEHIYILLEWGAPIEEVNNIAISFEQDEGRPDFNLSNGRADSYYQGYYKDGNFVISDTHYDSDYTYKYTGKEQQDGSLKGGYKNGKWALEWKIPMNSGDKYDIYIDKYPTEVGFSIIDTFMVRGIFPPGADNYDPRTWGTMTIIDKRLK